MANSNDILREINGTIPQDVIRRKYLRELSTITKRNVVAYYSGWLDKPAHDNIDFLINDEDKNGFMNAFQKIDKKKGLDLILHLPGGGMAATESIIDYIRSMFGANIRTIIPQISMSGGTIMACLGKEIWMGKHSNLGPTDPQLNWVSAIKIVRIFESAKKEINENPSNALFWQPMLSRWDPTILETAQSAIAFSDELNKKVLKEGMFKDDQKKDEKVAKIAKFFVNDDTHKEHSRHIHREDLKAQGLVIKDIEDDQSFQDAVLSVHHAFMITLMNTPVTKIIESDRGLAFIKAVQRNPSHPLS